MKLREGHTFRVYDGKRFTIALDPESHGGCYSPEIHVYDRARRHRPIHVPVPHIKWRHAYKFRKFGLIRLYRFESHLIYKLFSLRSNAR